MGQTSIGSTVSIFKQAITNKKVEFTGFNKKKMIMKDPC